MPLIPAATVILTRQVGPAMEIFLVRRHRKSTFMSNAHVFPGGKVDPADGAVEVAAIRELFEEAGVLIAEAPAEVEDAPTRAAWRHQLNSGALTFAELRTSHHIVPGVERLHYWSNWITPSMEPKRFDAKFFLAELPAGQEPSFDDKETTEGIWLTPAEALARHEAGTIKLPPPQIFTLLELRNLGTVAAAIDSAPARKADRFAILPRLAALPGEGGDGKMALLLPWDREYHSRGQGEELAVTNPRHFERVQDVAESSSP